jgi:hypothetical protein
MNRLIEEENEATNVAQSLNAIPTKEIWYKFNDTSVEEINLNENALIGTILLKLNLLNFH